MSTKKRGRSRADNDPHRSREQSRYDSPIASREFITTVLKEEKGPIDYETLAEKLSLTGDADAMEALRRRVGAMLRDGQLIQNRKRGLVPVDTEALIAGRISAHPDGFGFLITDDDDKDVYLNGKQMRQVLHGDRVVVCITGTDQRGRREGRIVDVVERANKTLVGRLSIDRGTVVVSPDNKRIHQDLLIAAGELSDAVHGDMVVAEIIEQPTRRHQPVGRVVEVLGQHLRPGMEIDVALHSHGIPSEWPEAVVEQASAFSATVNEHAAGNRKDVRQLSLITIDGADARDFDDAVWCERLDKGWRLIVAIADVAHYVDPGSPLDQEAIDRGTSVYFPGRVVPMLPEVLSNGLCSLNPNVDRLCMLCEMTLDEEAVVTKTRFHNGIMRSHARLTYDQVSEMLSEPASPLRDKHQPLVPMIEELHRLYKALAQKRRKRGAIEFDSNETHIIFDENKKIREIVPIQRNDAHKLIEECMILANIEAAAFLEKHEIPALYRVHAGPKAERLVDLRAFLALRGLTLGGGESPTALDYAALAEDIRDLPDRSVIQTVMLRSMQQAVYQPANEGHFGLALEQYAHFTSPIRRYPDLLVHRAIKHLISRRKVSDYRYSREAMQALGESCSMTERRAEEASREVVAWLKCEYMQEHVGSEFKGVISAVTSFGLFVELTGIHVEGLVHITNLSRDYYRFDQAAQSLTGERTGRQYHLGDAIVVRVAAVNLEDRKIDFNEVEHRSSRGKAARRKAPVNAVQSSAVQPSIAAAGQAAEGQQPKKIKSAEQRRKEKRRRKQKRRDLKRAEQRAANRAAASAQGQAEAMTGAPETVPQGKASLIDPVITNTTGRQKGKMAENDSARELHMETEQKAASSAVSKKTTTRQAAAKQAVSKKAVAKKAAAKEVVSKTAATPVAVSKKTAAKKAITRKATSKKAVAKKAAASMAVAEEAVSSQVAASDTVSSTTAAASTVVAGKTVTKKSVAKKAATKKVATKKSTAKKSAAKKAVTKKAAAKKAVAKKVATKKAAAKKAVAKKAVTKKAVAKKAVAKKAITKKAVAKKAVARKAITKKAAAKGAVVRKAVAKKAAGKKAVAKKAVTKKSVSKKAAGKAVSKKVATRKSAASKAVTGKVTSKKVAAGKAVAKKASAGGRHGESSAGRKKSASRGKATAGKTSGDAS
ncbi:ribonuclease R [Granulosicoccus sp. 3-233]|uniref:ribonuclease R n=1 Tax=Granulosicoccus sp. 3-233 TaxID=3417969 RepID=UPI003D337436